MILLKERVSNAEGLINGYYVCSDVCVYGKLTDSYQELLRKIKCHRG